jgi:hypothetical protein
MQPFLFRMKSNRAKDQVPIQIIEKSSDVQIYYPIPTPTPLSGGGYCLKR